MLPSGANSMGTTRFSGLCRNLFGPARSSERLDFRPVTAFPKNHFRSSNPRNDVREPTPISSSPSYTLSDGSTFLASMAEGESNPKLCLYGQPPTRPDGLLTLSALGGSRGKPYQAVSGRSRMLTELSCDWKFTGQITLALISSPRLTPAPLAQVS
jgi:hypothetical protein